MNFLALENHFGVINSETKAAIVCFLDENGVQFRIEGQSHDDKLWMLKKLNLYLTAVLNGELKLK